MDHSALWAIGVGITGTLTTAIGVLWKIVSYNITDTREKLSNCESKHDEQNCRVEELAVKLGTLEGRMMERHETVEKLERLDSGIESLSHAVVELVQQQRGDRSLEPPIQKST